MISHFPFKKKIMTITELPNICFSWVKFRKKTKIKTGKKTSSDIKKYEEMTKILYFKNTVKWHHLMRFPMHALAAYLISDCRFFKLQTGDSLSSTLGRYPLPHSSHWEDASNLLLCIHYHDKTFEKQR